MASYDTNLASEFLVLASLHRRGIDAFLTLGNKKGVDIAVATPGANTVTIEVKGVAGKHDWPASNIRVFNRPTHLYALVSFAGSIGDPRVMPDIWLIPSPYLEPFVQKYSGRSNVSRASVLKEGGRFLHAWHLIEEVIAS